jgi:hypothetical protein
MNQSGGAREGNRYLVKWLATSRGELFLGAKTNPEGFAIT